MEYLVAIMGIIWPFLSLIVFLYLHYSTKNRIHKALIESGRDASILVRPHRRARNLKNGIVTLMAGLGLFVGMLLEKAGLEEGITYVACMLTFIGVGLIGFYAYEARQQQKNSELERVEDLV